MAEGGGVIVLEEFEFTRSADIGGAAAWIADRAVTDDATRNRLKSHLVVLHDNDFTHFVRHATEVSARIGLDYETKTVMGQLPLSGSAHRFVQCEATAPGHGLGLGG